MNAVHHRVTVLYWQSSVSADICFANPCIMLCASYVSLDTLTLGLRKFHACTCSYCEADTLQLSSWLAQLPSLLGNEFSVHNQVSGETSGLIWLKFISSIFKVATDLLEVDHSVAILVAIKLLDQCLLKFISNVLFR